MAIDLSRDVVLRWDTPDATHLPLIQQSGATAVVTPLHDEGFERACGDAGLRFAALPDLRFCPLAELEHQPARAPVVLTDGAWPGVSRGGDVVIATATQKPWINANGYLARYLRALYPDRPAALGYLPDERAGLKPGRLAPFETLELALIEAWVFGGNYLLAVEPRYREALLRSDERAVSAWKRLGRTARWLRRNAPLFGQPVAPAVTALIEQGEACAELANLLYRHGASPALEPAGRPPAPNGAPRTLLAAVNISPPAEEARKLILAHAESGCTVVVDGASADPWWRAGGMRLLRQQEDRDFYSVGRGRIVAYKEPVSDQSSFASDVVDLITPERRPVRVWSVHAGIFVGTAAPPDAGKALLHIVNYGSPLAHDAMAQIQGAFTRAVMLRPDGPPLDLKPVRRGPVTEVMIPELTRLCVIAFS
jgi:hypothetical protein